MYHGIVVVDKLFLGGIAYWKTGKRDVKELSKYLEDKAEGYLKELSESDIKALIYLFNNTTLIKKLKEAFPNISFHTFEGFDSIKNPPFFIGFNQIVFNLDIHNKLPGHYALLNELDPEIISEMEEYRKRRLPDFSLFVTKCLNDMGFSDIPIQTYFSRGNGDSNSPPIRYVKAPNKIE